ncbi:DUF5132 domain-containing protein [Streptomyces paludis]|uniref:DUF5132 domain-containing protein n=1 Tax=Streptomyces paludis TaxID=2282738 RepID=A0A345HJ91_9ACTN|nr:DUF5132 domain-containing protein [Streptomyces paludis]AXG76765.1 DUF5132 domain-containing protein [Streptomyces paludis]
MLPVVPPFLLGLLVAPLAKRLAKPLVFGVVKTSVGLAMEVKKVAHQANEGLHDLAAEATAEMISAQLRADADADTKLVKPRSEATASGTAGPNH